MSRAEREPGEAATSTGSDIIVRTPTETRDGSAVNHPAIPDAVQQEALRRHRQGWAVIPLYPGSKRPVDGGWPDRAYTVDEVEKAFPAADPERNIAPRNLGVVLGTRSQGLVVVDLDAADPQIAALALPPTGLRDGRPSRPNAHWFYRVAGNDPFTKESFTGTIDDKPLIELLGDGQQVVIPPSGHESGEHRAWVIDGEPAEIDAEALRAAAGRAAAFAEIALVWERLGGRHHDASLPLVGGLLRAEIDPEIIDALLDHIWDSPERNEVHNAVWNTVAKQEAGEPFTGWRAFRELCGDEYGRSIDHILAWLGVDGAEDERPVVITGPGRLQAATHQAWTALKLRNAPEFLFSQATHPVRVEVDDKGRAVIVPLDVYRMRYHLLEEIRWLTANRKGDLVPADASLELARNVLATPNAQLPPLTTVTVAPVLSPAGEVQVAPGYHAENRSYYLPLPGHQVPAVSSSPTAAEVARAKTLLLEEYLGNFPFDSEAELANALALALLPFGRSIIAGPTPPHFVEAPKPGTGKSLLADTITQLMCGPAGAASVAETTDEEEWRKRITATLATGSPFVYIDNITQRLKSSALSSALTKMQWADRILGKSEEVVFDIRVVWIVTANNAALSTDVARRSVRIRLNANVEDPYNRGPEHFRHPNLKSWLGEAWGELVWACLTLWRAWVVADKPRGNVVLGSFEEWAAIMGGVLDVAGVPGFLGNKDEFIGLAAEDASGWRQLVDDWWDRFGSDEVRTVDLYTQVACGIDGFDYPGKRGQESSITGKTTAFGMDLRKQRDVIYGRLKISVKTVNGKPVYFLTHLDGERRTSKDYEREEAARQAVRPEPVSKPSSFNMFGVMPNRERVRH